MDHDDPLSAARGVLIGTILMIVVIAVSVAVYPYVLWAWGYAAAHPYHWPRGWGW